MEAKEKARELVDKMLAVYDIDNIAIDCALIAVDEILNSIQEIFETFEERQYWQQVKQEIEKL
jgi:hypothetical protein